MIHRFALAALLAITLAACAPSADIRIPNADGSIRPGRVAVVPVRADGDSIEVWDQLYAGAEFSDAADHDAAFWTSLTADLERELGWDGGVRLAAPTPATGFKEVRALIQGAGGYDSGRWSVRTVSVPDSVSYAALDAEHVVFVQRPTLNRETRSTGGGINGIGGRERVLVAQAEVVWMDASQASPRLVQTVEGVGAQRGALFAKEINRDSWSAAVKDLAEAIAREVAGPR